VPAVDIVWAEEETRRRQSHFRAGREELR